MSKHTITIEGFVAKDPESSAAGSHTKTTVTIPVTPRKKQGNEWVDDDEKTIWWEAEFWDEHGDVIQHTVRKGDLVTVTGSPEIRPYTTKDGSARYSARVTGRVALGVIPRARKSSPGGSVGQWGNSPQIHAASGTGGGSDDVYAPF